MSFSEKIKTILAESIEVKQQVLQNADFLLSIEEVVNTIVKGYQQNKKVLFCGNGGSAADAQHLAAELSGRFFLNRKPLFAEALISCVVFAFLSFLIASTSASSAVIVVRASL
jgi:D-sedoheptulose 7-phosphate isomerase